MRSLARESVFKYIFSRLFNQGDEGLFDVLCNKLNQSDKDFASQLLMLIDNSYDEYISKIENLAVGYKINRIHATDRCALLIGFAELDNFPDTPTAVIINESVNLASKYSTENSTDFVNGMLAEYSKER